MFFFLLPASWRLKGREEEGEGAQLRAYLGSPPPPSFPAAMNAVCRAICAVGIDQKVR